MFQFTGFDELVERQRREDERQAAARPRPRQENGWLAKVGGYLVVAGYWLQERSGAQVEMRPVMGQRRMGAL